MYVLMIAFPKRRSITALSTAAIFVILSLLPIGDMKILAISDIPKAVNWNVILMISGTMIIVDYFIESKMPNVIAESLLRIAPDILWVTVLMSVFSGLISAFIDNVATVLMVAPVAMVICKKLNVSPV
jgi:Na+/H+ antiporter NhaD/arsenite permease-like protein